MRPALDEHRAEVASELRTLAGAGPLPEGGDGGFLDLLGVLAVLPLGVGVCRVAPRFPLEAANQRFQRWMLSVAAADAAGGDIAGEINALVAAVAATGRSQRLEGLRVSPRSTSGEASQAALYDVVAYPLRDARGRATRVLQVVTDVTERARSREEVGALQRLAEGRRIELEALQLRLERMAALDKLKSDFMNLTTHELRSPLAIVYGYLSMIQSGVLGELSAELGEAVSASVQSVELMMQLVTELVEMARMDDSHLADRPREEVDVAEVVTEAAARVAASERHRLCLEAGGEPVLAVGDRSQLLRVFSNLVDNAVKYSPAGGEVRVSLRRRADQAVVDVTDQGIGIPAPAMDRLFTRFGRIATPASQGISGTGLGLYLCREMVRRIGGDVTATSVEGRGSTFTVRLPLAPPARRGSSPLAAPAAAS